MPRAGPLKQILRTLTVAELRSLRRTHCPQVTEYDGNKTAFVDRLRNSLKRSIDEGTSRMKTSSSSFATSSNPTAPNEPRPAFATL